MYASVLNRPMNTCSRNTKGMQVFLNRLMNKCIQEKQYDPFPFFLRTFTETLSDEELKVYGLARVFSTRIEISQLVLKLMIILILMRPQIKTIRIYTGLYGNALLYGFIQILYGFIRILYERS